MKKEGDGLQVTQGDSLWCWNHSTISQKKKKKKEHAKTGDLNSEVRCRPLN